MRTLLDPPPDQRGTEALPSAGGDAELAVRIVDHGLHLGGLLLHAGLYLALVAVAGRFPFGPHLLAGILFGDFAGYCIVAATRCRDAPRATVAEFALFVVLFAVWWHGYRWSEVAEFRALFFLGAFGALTGRIGQAAVRSRASGWD